LSTLSSGSIPSGCIVISGENVLLTIGTCFLVLLSCFSFLSFTSICSESGLVVIRISSSILLISDFSVDGRFSSHFSDLMSSGSMVNSFEILFSPVGTVALVFLLVFSSLGLIWFSGEHKAEEIGISFSSFSSVSDWN